jgi:stage II sporulation protein AA (anti-sigma F factor antagonist)
MKLSAQCREGCLRLSLEGELDHHSARETLSGMTRMLDDYMPRICVLDFSGVSFMDSSGIALILRVYKQMRESGGEVCVENPRHQPQKVLEAAGIDRIVRVLNTVREGER